METFCFNALRTLGSVSSQGLNVVVLFLILFIFLLASFCSCLVQEAVLCKYILRTVFYPSVC